MPTPRKAPYVYKNPETKAKQKAIRKENNKVRQLRCCIATLRNLVGTDHNLQVALVRLESWVRLHTYTKHPDLMAAREAGAQFWRERNRIWAWDSNAVPYSFICSSVKIAKEFIERESANTILNK